MDNTIELRLVNLAIAEALFGLIDASRSHLRVWLPWVDTTDSVEDTRNFIDFAMGAHAQKSGAHYGVYVDGQLSGLCGFNKIIATSRLGEIGYWLAQPYIDQGFATRAVRALINIGFEEYGLNKIEIRCATKNMRSRAVPERLGLKYEATLRQSEFFHDEYHDVAVYSVLRCEMNTLKNTAMRLRSSVKLLPSKNFEACVRKIKQEMLPYYKQYQLEWDDESKLERYKEFELWSVCHDTDVGFLMHYEKDALFYIAELFIEPKFRNKGFGGAAIKKVKEMAAQRGFSEIRIGVFKNSPAFALYKRVAFELEEEGPYTYQLVMKVS